MGVKVESFDYLTDNMRYKKKLFCYRSFSKLNKKDEVAHIIAHFLIYNSLKYQPIAGYGRLSRSQNLQFSVKVNFLQDFHFFSVKIRLNITPSVIEAGG